MCVDDRLDMKATSGTRPHKKSRNSEEDCGNGMKMDEENEELEIEKEESDEM